MAHKRARPGTPLLQRLMDNAIVTEGGCWIWDGHTNSEGYGTINVDYMPKLVHKLAYELLVGPVPKGKHLDHLCHGWDGDCPGGPLCLHRPCFNPEHLHPKTPRGNTLALGSKSIAAINARKMHCPKNHRYTKSNTRVTKKGQRICKTYQRDNDKGRKR